MASRGAKADSEAAYGQRHQGRGAGPRGLGLYEFGRANNGALELRASAVLAVTTPREQWAYAATFAPNADFVGDRPIRVSVHAIVHQGTVDFGILSKDERAFQTYANIRRSSVWQVLQLVIPIPSEAGPLVIRNASELGESRVQFRVAETEDPTADPDHQVTLDSAAAKLQAAVKAFRATVSTDGVPGLAGESLRPIEHELRQMMADFGVPVVWTVPDKLGELFATIPDPDLYRVADKMAKLRPLDYIPYWQFDSYGRSPDLAVHVRHALWLAFRRRGMRDAIKMPWHESTQLALQFGSYFSRILYCDGCYEPNEFTCLNRLLRPGMVFIDGGANEGAYTIFASARVGSNGRVIAVEPSLREVARLEENIVLNAALNVDVVSAALADRCGEALLSVAVEEHAGLNTLGGFTYENIDTEQMQRVECTTIANLVDRYQLSQIDIIKLDVEGAELRSLRGADDFLESMKPLILLELSNPMLENQGDSQADLLTFLTAKQYRILRFDAHTGKPVPVEGDMEQPSHNIIAVHRERDWGLFG